MTSSMMIGALAQLLSMAPAATADAAPATAPDAEGPFPGASSASSEAEADAEAAKKGPVAQAPVAAFDVFWDDAVETAPAEGAPTDTGAESPSVETQAAAQSQPVAVPNSELEAPKRARAAAPGVPALDRPARPDREIDWRLEVMPGGGSSYVPHKSYGLFDISDQKMANGGIELRFDRKLSGPVFMGGGMAYRYLGNSAEDVFGDDESALDLHEVLGFLRFAYVPVEGIDVYGVLAMGPSFVDYVVTNSDDARGKNVALVADGRAGAMFYLPKRWLPNRGASRMTFGLDLGFGYSFRTATSIEPTIELDEDPLATDFPDLGELRPSAFTWRTGLFIRFM